MKITCLVIKRGNPKILSLTSEEEGWAKADGRRHAEDQRLFPPGAAGLHLPVELWSPAWFQIPALPLRWGRPLPASCLSFPFPKVGITASPTGSTKLTRLELRTLSGPEFVPRSRSCPNHGALLSHL